MAKPDCWYETPYYPVKLSGEMMLVLMTLIEHHAPELNKKRQISARSAWKRLRKGFEDAHKKKK